MLIVNAWIEEVVMSMERRSVNECEIRFTLNHHEVFLLKLVNTLILQTH